MDLDLVQAEAEGRDQVSQHGRVLRVLMGLIWERDHAWERREGVEEGMGELVEEWEEWEE